MKPIKLKFYALFLMALGFVLSGQAIAQDRSEDRDKPTPVTSNEIFDDLDGSDDQYFYRFSVGPGKLTITFEVSANGTNAGATLDLFDTKSKSILSAVLAQGVDKGSERVVKTLTSARAREIVMRIKGIKYGDSGGTGTYKITFDGPILLKGPGGPN